MKSVSYSFWGQKFSFRTDNTFYDHDYMAKWDSKLGGFRIYTGWYMRQRTHQLPGTGHATADKASESSRLSLYYAGVKRPGVGTPDLDLELRVNYLDENRRFLDEDGELGLPRDDKNRRTRFGIDIYLNYYGIPGNQLSLCLGIYDDQFMPGSNLDPKADNVSASRSSLAGRLRVRAASTVWMASRNWFMNSGVRASVPAGVSPNRAPTLIPSSSRKVRPAGLYSIHGRRSVKDGGRS